MLHKAASYKWWMGAAIGALLAILSFFLFHTKEVPAAVIQDLNGHTIAVKELKGQPVFVHFWATNCPGCIREMPIWIDIYNKYHQRGVKIIAVAMSYDVLDFVKAYVKGNQLPFTVSFDKDGSIAHAFGDVRLTPTTIWIDRQGNWVRTSVGEVSKEDVAKWLDQQSIASNNAK